MANKSIEHHIKEIVEYHKKIKRPLLQPIIESRGFTWANTMSAVWRMIDRGELIIDIDRNIAPGHNFGLLYGGARKRKVKVKTSKWHTFNGYSEAFDFIRKTLDNGQTVKNVLVDWVSDGGVM